MYKTKIHIIISFILIFLAGLAFGYVFGFKQKMAPQRTWLAQELDLNTEQEKKIKEIWTAVVQKTGSTPDEEKIKIAAERDRKVLEILNPEQVPDYSKIQEEFGNNIKSLANDRKTAISGAVEQTKKILTEEQRIKYETLLKEQKVKGMKPVNLK